MKFTYKGSDGRKELRKFLAESEKEESEPEVDEEKEEPETDYQSDENFIYVPSINLYVARQRSLLGENWSDCTTELHSRNQRMPTPKEFIEFLKYIKTHEEEIYKEITEIKTPWRAEWLDASFELKGKELLLNYYIFDVNGKIELKSEKLDANTLRENKNPGISLEDYLNNNHTSQGLPTKKVSGGKMYYWKPIKGRVAGFVANSGRTYLDCSGFPSSSLDNLWVRAVKLASII